METLAIPIQGISPLLLSNPASMRPSDAELTTKASSIPSPEDEAEQGSYRMPSGGLAIPSPAFRSCLVRAGTGRRMGKTAATTIIKGSVFSIDEYTPLLDPDGAAIHDYEIDMRRVVVPTGGIVRARPKVPKWSCIVNFEIDTEFIAAEQVCALLAIGGRTVGVGDFRPQKSGPFGRFVLTTD